MSVNGLGSSLLAAMSQPKSRSEIGASDDSNIATTVTAEESGVSANTISEAPADKESTSSNPMQELRDYMNMSYAEKMQWSWMSAHGISKADFNAMSGEDKQKIVDQMREDLKAKMRNLGEGSPSISVTA